MASAEDIERRLAVLYRIHGMSSPDATLEDLLSKGDTDGAAVHIDTRLDAIAEILSSRGMARTSDLYRPLEKELRECEYVIPPELEAMHPEILKCVTSGKTIDMLPYGGLLLYGEVGGTGKTEYMMFLKHLAGDRAVFVVANLSKIRNADSPGNMLQELYRDLEQQARADGRMRVVCFDEFDKLVNRYATHHSSVKEEDYSNVSAKRTQTRSHRETRQTLQVDETGEELFSTLKTIISGTEDIRHVFTFATSNQAAYPETLLRRLQPVELKPFGFPTFHGGQLNGEVYPVYEGYVKRVPRVVRVLEASYNRQKGSPSQSLTRIREELTAMLVDCQSRHAPATDRETVGAIALRNNAILDGLFGYFGFDIMREHDFIDAQTAFFWDRDPLPFGGEFRRSVTKEHNNLLSLQYVSTSSFGDRKLTPEEAVMATLTPDKIAKHYKANPEVFDEYESAKRQLRDFLFPQIPAYEVMKAQAPPLPQSPAAPASPFQFRLRN